MFKFFKISFSTFILSFLIICSLLSFFIYKILISDFIELQNDQNEKNVLTLLKKINTEITNINNITTDYSKWDDTHEYLENRNENFIYENFREGTNTLVDLGLSFVIFTNLNDEIYYSKLEDETKKSFDTLSKSIVQRFKNYKTTASFFKDENKLIYVVKQKVLKSDSTGKTNGHMITGKFLSRIDLDEFTNIFDNLKVSYTKHKDSEIELKLVNDTSVHIYYEIFDNYIKNTIEFFDIDNKYVFSLQGNNKTNIIKKGERTIYILSFLISFILFILFYILYKNQKIVERYNNMLEKKVQRRTKQLEKTLKNLKEKNHKLHKISNTDVLTNIRNRRSFFQDSKKALKNSIKKQEDLCLLIMDIDHFKSINDTYGHAIGDEVLRSFSKLVNEVLDESMIFGRIGGEEFCITFENKTFEEATIIAESIRKKIENFTLKIEDKEIKFTLSLGLAIKKEHKHIDELVQIADELLYKAKNEGRNRLVREKIR